MFTGLNEIHSPAPPIAASNVNTEDIDGKQSMENMFWRAVGGITHPTPAKPTPPSMALLRLHTHPTQVYMVMAYYNHTQPSPTHMRPHTGLGGSPS